MFHTMAYLHIFYSISREKSASYCSHSENCMQQESIRSYVHCFPFMNPTYTHSLKKRDACAVINVKYI